MIELIKWSDALNNCKYDASVGIKIAKLSGNESFSTYVTVIDSGKYVNPHYHKHGDEHYHIISGTGTLKLKNMLNNQEKTIAISERESFTIPENTSHQLINSGHVPLVLMFSCPTSHLESDRYFP
jgi:mannose-6-phosphate isomerase-like protein (cupin superfamily)